MAIIHAIGCLVLLVLWTRWDDLHSIAKTIQDSRDSHLLVGFKYDDPVSRKNMRSKAADWIKEDMKYAWWWGFRSIVRGISLAAGIFLCTLFMLWLNSLMSTNATISNFFEIASRLGLAMVDGATFDLIFLTGGQGEYPASSLLERIIVFTYLLSGILIISALIAYLVQTLISVFAVFTFPIHTYWAATDSREDRRSGLIEKLLRFLLDFSK